MNYRPTMSVYNMRHAVKPVLCKLRVNHPQQHRRSVLVIDDGNVFAGVTAVHGDANKNRFITLLSIILSREAIPPPTTSRSVLHVHFLFPLGGKFRFLCESSLVLQHYNDRGSSARDASFDKGGSARFFWARHWWTAFPTGNNKTIVAMLTPRLVHLGH